MNDALPNPAKPEATDDPAQARIEADSPDLTQVLHSLSGTISHAYFPAGDRAALRRLRPDQDWPPAFWRVLFDSVPAELRGVDNERKWAVYMQAVAIMAPGNFAPKITLGRAMFAAGGEQAEPRLLRLLRCQGEALEDQIRLTARLLHGHNQSVDQAEFARLLFLSGDKAVKLRRKIARDFFSAANTAKDAKKNA